MCRICLEVDGTGEMISPCGCAGSMAHVHPVCLKAWLSRKRHMRSGWECELCQQKLRVQMLSPPWRSLLPYVLFSEGATDEIVVVRLVFFLLVTLALRHMFWNLVVRVALVAVFKAAVYWHMFKQQRQSHVEVSVVCTSFFFFPPLFSFFCL